MLTATREELQNLHLQIPATASGTLRSEMRGQHASSSNTRGNLALHAIMEDTRHSAEYNHRIETKNHLYKARARGVKGVHG